MKRFVYLCVVWFVAIGLGGVCAAQDARAYEIVNKSKGQVVYVPAYSHIYHGPKTREMQLTVTLSFRNTSQTETLTVTEVKYYDSKGLLVDAYTKRTFQVPPMATAEHIVPYHDETGGSGANFLLTWHADKPVSSPIVQAVMIGTSRVGISFVCEGKVLQEMQ